MCHQGHSISLEIFGFIFALRPMLLGTAYTGFVGDSQQAQMTADLTHQPCHCSVIFVPWQRSFRMVI